MVLTEPSAAVAVAQVLAPPVKTSVAVKRQMEAATSTTPAAVARAQEAPEETHHRLVQLPLEQTVAPVAADLFPQSPESLFVTQQVAVEVFTGMVAMLAPAVLVLKQTQRLVAPVVKVARTQT